MPGHQELAKHVLSWITCAKRPLAAPEIQHAWAVRDSGDELDEDSLPEIEEMVSVCAGLVTIDHDGGILRLVHYTTQEYFEQTLDTSLPNAHFEIAKTCASYLSFSTFSGGSSFGNPWFGMLLEANPLYYYAACNWGHHAREAANLPDEVLDFLQSDGGNVDAANEALCAHKEPSRWDLEDATGKVRGLHLAAHFGLESATAELLAAGYDPNMTDSRNRTPLFYAAKQGHVDVVRVLLATGKVDVNVANDWHSTPVYEACNNNHPAVVQALLDSGQADVEKRTFWGRGFTPLETAVTEGHEAAVRVLLDSKLVDVNATDGINGRTILGHAKCWHRSAIAQLLRAHGARDVDGSEDGNEDEDGEKDKVGNGEKDE